MKKLQALPIVKCVQVVSIILSKIKPGSIARPTRKIAIERLPDFQRQQRRLAALPEQKLRGSNIKLPFLGLVKKSEARAARRSIRTRRLLPHRDDVYG